MPEAELIHNLGFVLTVAGDLPAALARFDEADARFMALGAPIGLNLVARARALLRANLHREARLAATWAVDALEDGRAAAEAAEARVLLATAELADDDPEAAIATAELARRVLHRQGRPGLAAQAEHVVVRARARLGRRDRRTVDLALRSRGRARRGRPGGRGARRPADGRSHRPGPRRPRAGHGLPGRRPGPTGPRAAARAVAGVARRSRPPVGRWAPGGRGSGGRGRPGRRGRPPGADGLHGAAGRRGGPRCRPRRARAAHRGRRRRRLGVSCASSTSGGAPRSTSGRPGTTTAPRRSWRPSWLRSGPRWPGSTRSRRMVRIRPQPAGQWPSWRYESAPALAAPGELGRRALRSRGPATDWTARCCARRSARRRCSCTSSSTVASEP